MRSVKRYLWAVLGCWALFLLLGLGALLQIYRFGELTSLDDVIDRQKRTGGLYGTAVWNDRISYKLKRYEAKRPHIISIGSSRALPDTAFFFRETFVNMAQTVFAAEHVIPLIDRLLAVHKPEIVILYLDFWWFSDEFSAPPRETLDEAPRAYLPATAAFYKFLAAQYDRGRGAAAMTHLLTPRSAEDADAYIGFAASLEHAGYWLDGSFRNYKSPRGCPLRGAGSGYRQRQESLHGDGQRHWDALIKALAYMRDKGIQPIVVLPPVSPRLLRHLESARDLYPALVELRHRLRTFGGPMFDVIDGAAAGITACEFTDDVHAGQIAHLRIALRIADKVPAFAAVFDADAARAAIDRYRGWTYFPQGFAPDKPTGAPR